jgi:hypothetical protein
MEHFFTRTSPSGSIPPFDGTLCLKVSFPFSHTSSLESSFRVSRGICLCYEGPHSLSPTFGFFKGHCLSMGFSFFRFIFVMFIFFDGVPTRSRFGLFFRHV